MGASPPWTVIRELVVADRRATFSFPRAIALQVRGPVPDGTLLRFIEDSVGDRAREWTLDVPGQIIPWGGSTRAEILFPTTIDAVRLAAELLEIVAYHDAAALALPAAAINAGAAIPRPYDEVAYLAEHDGLTLAAGSTLDLVTYDDSNPFSKPETVGDTWWRRFGTLRGGVSFEVAFGGAVGSVHLFLECRRTGGTDFRFTESRGSRTTWESISGAAQTASRSIQWELPLIEWRLRIHNGNSTEALTRLDAHLYLTTSTASNGGNRS